MSHLTAEVLARLVDEPPTPEEAIHIADCGSCRAGLTDLRAQTRTLASLRPIAPPPAVWDGIASRWHAERTVIARRRSYATVARRFAAAVGLFLLGATVQSARTGFRGNGDAGPFVVTTGTPSRTHLLSARRPESLDEAIARVRAAELVYQRALLDYSAVARPEPPRDFVARLATLDAIVLTTRTALERAPADPVINTYHIAALAERETLLDQMR